jgi:tryptophanyl-tRNA synthetase
MTTTTTTPTTPRGAVRRLSLLTPSGHLTLGNHLGALRPMVEQQHTATCFYGISDLHAMTTGHDPAALGAATRELQTLLLAAGLGPAEGAEEGGSTVFRQSHVPAHTELAYLLECTAHVGELDRMIQFKEKGRGRPGTRASLFTYPVLMAADILLYRPREVPVGADQRQHVELTRDLAIRFNRTYGQVFTIPEVTVPTAGARVRDLQEPARKMAKSGHHGPGAGAGVVFLLDPPDVVARKIARAVTDSDTGPDAVRHDPAAKPGVSNLLEVVAACRGTSPGEAAEGIATYGQLKRQATDAVVSVLEPLQRRYAELAGDPDHVDAVFEAGAQRCRAETAPVLAAAREAMGL